MIQSVGALFLQSRRRWHEKREDEKEKSIWKRIVLGVLLVMEKLLFDVPEGYYIDTDHFYEYFEEYYQNEIQTGQAENV